MEAPLATSTNAASLVARWRDADLARCPYSAGSSTEEPRLRPSMVKSLRNSRSSLSGRSSAFPCVRDRVVILRQMPDSIGPDTESAADGTVTAVAFCGCRDAQPSTKAPQITRIRPVPML